MNIKKYLVVLPFLASCSSGLGEYNIVGDDQIEGSQGEDVDSNQIEDKDLDTEEIVNLLLEYVLHMSAGKCFQILDSIKKFQPLIESKIPDYNSQVKYISDIINCCKKKIYPEHYDDYCHIAAVVAAGIGFPSFIQALHRNGYDINQLIKVRPPFCYDVCVSDRILSPLGFAAYNNQLDTCKILLQLGANVDGIGTYHNVHSIGTYHDEYLKASRITPIQLVAITGNIKICELLLGAGADLKEEDKDGTTLLHLAAQGGHLKLLQSLEGKGLDIHAVDKDGRNLLHCVAQFGHFALFQYLEEKGLDIHAVDNHGTTLLHLAAQFGHLKLLQSLEGKGLDIHAVDNYGKTVGHFAAQGDRLNVMKYLVKEEKVDVRQKDANGNIPADLAPKYQHSELVSFLRKEDLRLWNKEFLKLAQAQMLQNKKEL